MDLKNKFLLTLFCISFQCIVVAQISNSPLVKDFSLVELNEIESIVKKSPIVHKNCNTLDKQTAKAYHDLLYNLREDIYVYLKLIKSREKHAKDLWITYINENIRNQNLSARLQRKIAFKDGWAKFSSNMLDIANVAKIIQKPSAEVMESTIRSLYYTLTVLDSTLSAMNLIVRAFTADAGNSAIGISFGDNWANVYTVLKSSIDLCYEAIDTYKSSGSTFTKKVEKFGSVMGVVAQFLNVYVNIDLKEMKEFQAELDKVYVANQSMQTNAYNELRTLRRIDDKLADILKYVATLYSGSYVIHLNNGGKQVRAERNQPGPNDNNYYQNLIRTQALKLSEFDHVEKCTPSKYFFKIFDGINKQYNPIISITRSSDKKRFYFGSTWLGRTYEYISLPTGEYDIKIHEGTSADGARVSQKEFKNYFISTAEDTTAVELHPFGRVNINVKTTNNIHQSYSYKIQNRQTNTYITSALASGLVKLDLPVNEDLQVKVDVRLQTQTVRNIRISPNLPTSINVVYNNNTNRIEPRAEIPNLSGSWKVMYTCDGESFLETVRIYHRGNYLRAIKTDDAGDRCVRAPNTTFTAVVEGLTGPMQLRYGTIENPSTSYISGTYTIISDKELTTGWGHRFRKIE